MRAGSTKRATNAWKYDPRRPESYRDAHVALGLSFMLLAGVVALCVVVVDVDVCRWRGSEEGSQGS